MMLFVLRIRLQKMFGPTQTFQWIARISLAGLGSLPSVLFPVGSRIKVLIDAVDGLFRFLIQDLISVPLFFQFIDAVMLPFKTVRRLPITNNEFFKLNLV